MSTVGERNRDQIKSPVHIHCEREERNQTNLDHVLGQALEVLLASGLNGFSWGGGGGNQNFEMTSYPSPGPRLQNRP